MTRKCALRNGFVTLDGQKFECEKKLIQEFKEACTQYGWKMSFVLREMMAGFIVEVRENPLVRSDEIEDDVSAESRRSFSSNL